MKINLAISVILFLINYVTFSQVTYDWSKHIDQTSANALREVAVMGIERDANGNVYTIGRLRGSADFDLASAGGNLASSNITIGDPFIVKYDSLGNFLWGDIITNGNSSDGRSVSIVLDNGGNAFVVGDTNTGGSGGGFLAKYSPTGTRLFRIGIGGYPGIESEVVTVDNAGGVYVGYKFAGTVDFDPGPGVVNRTAGGSADNYLAKYNSTTGAFQWVKIFGPNISFRDIEYDNLTNTIYTFGAFNGTQDFNPDAAVNNLSVPSSSAFVAQYNPSTGAYVNAYALNNSSGTQGVWDMKIQGDNLYGVFLYDGTVDFQTGAGTNILTTASNSIAIAKFKKSTMQVSWVYHSPIIMGWGSPSIRIAMNGLDELMIYGEYTGTQDFDPGAGVSNLTAGALGGNSFAAYSIDSSGNFVWAADIGENSASGRLYYHDLIADGKGGFYVAGDFDNSVSLDPSNNIVTYSEGTGPNDGFLAHYNICQPGVNTTSTVSICETGTKTLTATIGTGTWSIVSGGGSITGTTYTPANVSSNTSVTVRYTDLCGNISDRTFMVNVMDSANNTMPTTDICVGDSRTVTGTPSGGTWSEIGAGNILVGSYVPPNLLPGGSVPVSTIYTIAANGACPSTSDTVDFMVVRDSTVTATSSTANMCNGDTRTLTGTPQGGVWSVVSGPGNITGNTLTATGGGTIQVKYRVVGQCMVDSATQSITVTSTITVSAAASASSLCENLTRTMSGTPSGGSWNVLSGPGTITGGVLTPSGVGTVTIEYSASSSCGNGADTIDVVINPVPNANAGIDENICTGDTVTLTATGGGTYQWTPGPTGASNQVYPIVTTGYRVDVTSDSGCIASDSVTIFVQSTGTATAQDDQGSSATGVQETIDVYTNDVGGINTIQILSGPSHGTATVSNGNVLYTSTAGYIGNDTLVYEICDANCGVVCDTAIVVIVVENDLTIPVGISPNGDGKNDVFNILGLSRYPNNSIQIFNRWGSLVFQAEPYLNDWAGQITTGALMGSEVVEGTYFYVLKLGEDLPSYNGYIELKK